MVDFLISQGASLDATNEEGDNAIDLWVIRMCYETALFLKQQGMQPKQVDYYEGRLAVLYDVELFIEKVENEEKVDSYNIFHQKIIKEQKGILFFMWLHLYPLWLIFKLYWELDI